MHISLKSSTGMTAAQQRVMQETGLVMSHSAALHHLRSQTTLARMQLHRIAGTVSPADAINAATRAAAIEQAPRVCTSSPKQAGCTTNCGQGRRCTCTGAPMPELAPRAARRAPTRIEQAVSDFGALDLTHKEHDTTAGEVAEQMTLGDKVMSRVYRWGWRVALVAAAGIWMTGCGGGDDHDDRFEPAVMPQGVVMVGDPVPGATVRPTATQTNRGIALVHHIGPQGTGPAAANLTRDDCDAAKRAGQICVVVRAVADGMGAEIGKWMLAEELGLAVCDLTESPNVDATLIRCANAAAALRSIR